MTDSSKWDKLRAAGQNGSVQLPSGIDLMRRINEGLVQKVPTEYLQKVRSKVCENCEELIEIGARVRPLMVDNQRIGWVRGIHNSERKILQRWIHDPNDYIGNVLELATTLTKVEIENLTALELRNLVELIRTMSEYDVSLFPYLSAFVTTSTSEALWYSYGAAAASSQNRRIELPDGKTMKLMAAPDHARLWATLCNYREQSKKRLDDNWNAVLIIRPTAGKSVDPLANQLKTIARQLQTDTTEPWERLLRVQEEVDVSDGWAHPADDEQGLLRELHGMLSHDKHEQVMEQVERRLVAEAEENARQIQEMVQKRGGMGITEETIVVETEEQVRKRELDLKRGRVVPLPASRDTEKSVSPADKIKHYQGFKEV